MCKQQEMISQRCTARWTEAHHSYSMCTLGVSDNGPLSYAVPQVSNTLPLIWQVNLFLDLLHFGLDRPNIVSNALANPQGIYSMTEMLSSVI